MLVITLAFQHRHLLMVLVIQAIIAQKVQLLPNKCLVQLAHSDQSKMEASLRIALFVLRVDIAQLKASACLCHVPQVSIVLWEHVNLNPALRVLTAIPLV